MDSSDFIQAIFNRIDALKSEAVLKNRNIVINTEDELLLSCFGIDNDDKKKAICINQINCSIEETNIEFTSNHNKMILLSLFYALSEKFRELSFVQKMEIVNQTMNINIKSFINARNDKYERYHKIDKQALVYYYDRSEYSNAMIDLFANVFNINLFIVEYSNGRFINGLYTLNNKFNSYKPSIILWHPNKYMYCPISINMNFKLYKECKLFAEFIKNKFIMIDPIMIKIDKSFIKDMNITNEKVIEDCYDNDLDVIYVYKTKPSRKCKKNVDSITDSVSSNIAITSNIATNINSSKDNVKDDNIATTPRVEKHIYTQEEDKEIEKNIETVIIPDYDKESLNKKSKIELEELLKKHNIRSTYKKENKYVKKTKSQMIDDLLNAVNF